MPLVSPDTIPTLGNDLGAIVHLYQEDPASALAHLAAIEDGHSSTEDYVLGHTEHAAAAKGLLAISLKGNQQLAMVGGGLVVATEFLDPVISPYVGLRSDRLAIGQTTATMGLYNYCRSDRRGIQMSALDYTRIVTNVRLANELLCKATNGELPNEGYMFFAGDAAIGSLNAYFGINVGAAVKQAHLTLRTAI